VADAETGQPLQDAEVVFLELRRLARANALGDARLEGIPVGAQLVRVRKIGYAPSEVRLGVKGDTSGAMFGLTRSVTELGAVKSRPRLRPAFVPSINAVDGESGRFLGPEVLDRERDRDFGVLMASVQVESAECMCTPARLVEMVLGTNRPGCSQTERSKDHPRTNRVLDESRAGASMLCFVLATSASTHAESHHP
jgi:hypothetical protein